MKTLFTKLLAGASVLAIAGTAAPAFAQDYYGYTRVPVTNYYSPYSGYAVDDYGYNPNPYYVAPRSAKFRHTVKSTAVGAAIGAGAGAVIGLTSRRGRVLRPALTGAGVGAGLGLGYGLLTRPSERDYGYGYDY